MTSPEIIWLSAVSLGLLLLIIVLAAFFIKQRNMLVDQKNKLMAQNERLIAQHEKLVAQERALGDMNVKLVLSQIRPHFLYNTLNAIYYLCEKDPETAQKAISDFADYLRGNMDSLESSSPISFRAELSHVKYYLNLEQLRLGDELSVVYSIHAEDFTLPPLTVETLVENAVKHGVAKAEDGGTVTISTWEGRDSYSVEIEDDGVGFDMDKQAEDGRTHIGIENVRRRLKEICNGELFIFSAPGEGTKATIKIPKPRQEERNGL